MSDLSSFTLILPAGQTSVFDVRLYGVRLLEVQIEGTGYEITYQKKTIVNGERIVRHLPTNGKLYVNEVSETQRKINVIIKTA